MRRREVAERIKEAREFGDISENSEYDDAKNEQAMLEAKIAQLEERLRDATRDRRRRGLDRRRRARLDDHARDAPAGKATYQLVGSAEADPDENRLSNESPSAARIHRAQEGRDGRRRHGAGRPDQGEDRLHQGRVAGVTYDAPPHRFGRDAPRSPTSARRPPTIARRPGPSRVPTRYRLAGRVMARRGQGKLVFLDLVDRSGRLQLLAALDVLGEEPSSASPGSRSATSSASRARPSAPGAASCRCVDRLRAAGAEPRSRCPTSGTA